MEPAKRKAGRPPTKKDPEELGPTLKLSLDADRLLTAQAKKVKISKRQYASAAVTFFAQSGLDPTKELPADLAAVGQKVEAGVANVRAHNADIGNRLFALTRGFEKTMYLFMQQQEHNMNVYLEGIEANLMRRLVSMESKLMLPMMEHVMRGYLEAHIGRGLGERIFIKALGEPDSVWNAQNKKVTEERDEQLVKLLREFMTDHKIPPAASTRRPAATPVPPKPPAATAAPAPAPAATPPKP